jgi:hypothetical protein
MGSEPLEFAPGNICLVDYFNAEFLRRAQITYGRDGASY